jgi:hypothetical protein
MALQHYEKCAFFIDGQLMSESTSVSVDSDPKLNAIETMQKGFSGVSPGSEMTQISVESAVPRIGFEYDFVGTMQAQAVVEFTFFAHGKKSTTKGFISKVGQKYGVNQAAAVSFEAMCEPLAESTLLSWDSGQTWRRPRTCRRARSCRCSSARAGRRTSPWTSRVSTIRGSP